MASRSRIGAAKREARGGGGCFLEQRASPCSFLVFYFQFNGLSRPATTTYSAVGTPAQEETGRSAGRPRYRRRFCFLSSRTKSAGLDEGCRQPDGRTDRAHAKQLRYKILDCRKILVCLCLVHLASGSPFSRLGAEAAATLQGFPNKQILVLFIASKVACK